MAKHALQIYIPTTAPSFSWTAMSLESYFIVLILLSNMLPKSVVCLVRSGIAAQLITRGQQCPTNNSIGQP
jgi:hypothetical protein